MTALLIEGAATAAAPARPALTGPALAARLEHLAHLYNQGLTPDDEIWAEVDALAASLPETDRSDWFEELFTALAVRDGDIELAAWPPDERDPDLIEADAARRVDEAVEHLMRGAAFEQAAAESGENADGA